MHHSALTTGQLFFETYWRPEFARILDVGSRDVNGTLRAVKPRQADYVGIDLTAGPGVDLVVKGPFDWPFPEAFFDMVVSTSCFEHDPAFWLTFEAMLRVVKPGGFIYINAPSNGPYHGYPYDHWRFYPDAGLALAQWSHTLTCPATLLESFIGAKDNDVWADAVMIFCRHPLPGTGSTLTVHEQLTGFSNVRQPAHAGLTEFQPLSEDARELNEARARIKHLEQTVQGQAKTIEQLQETRGAQSSVLGASVSNSTETSQFQSDRTRSEQDLADINCRNLRSAIPLDALETIQAGTLNYTYRGTPCLKNPFDLALYLKLLHQLQPKTIIEIGSHAGGSARWFADMLSVMDISGQVITVDLNPVTTLTADSRITAVIGDVMHLDRLFTDAWMARLEHPFLVIEDSAHLYDTTLAALRFFHPHLHPGDYMVIEDGIVNDLAPIGYQHYENGPNRAIMTFMNENPDAYCIDTDYCDHFGHNFTYNTNGYLRRLP